MGESPRGEGGATAVEYALLVSLIAAVIVLTVAAVGTTTGDLFNRPCEEQAAAGHPC